jgi:hypothetical protein
VTCGKYAGGNLTCDILVLARGHLRFKASGDVTLGEAHHGFGTALVVTALPGSDNVDYNVEEIVPETEMIEESKTDFEATKAELMAMKARGKSDKDCRKLADDEEDAVKKNVKAQQDVLDKMDKGEKCPTKGSKRVADAEKLLKKAEKDKKDADSAHSKSLKAGVKFATIPFENLVEGQCGTFFNQQSYKNAKSAAASAKKKSEQAKGALDNAKKELKDAKEAAKDAINKCQCDVKKKHADTLKKMNDDAKAANTKAWKKAADVRCLLDGTPLSKCKASAIPTVKAVKLTAATQAADCNKFGKGQWVKTSCTAVSGNLIYRTSGTNWQCESTTKKEYSLGTTAKFRVKNGGSSGGTHFIMAGWNKNPVKGGYGDIDFGISYTANGNVYVWENGSNKKNKNFGAVGKGQYSQYMSIAMEKSGTVKTYVGSSHLYTSTKKASGKYYFDTNPWDTGSGVDNLKMSAN